MSPWRCTRGARRRMNHTCLPSSRPLSDEECGRKLHDRKEALRQRREPPADSPDRLVHQEGCLGELFSAAMA